jgi:hypothetical protein
MKALKLIIFIFNIFLLKTLLYKINSASQVGWWLGCIFSSTQLYFLFVLSAIPTSFKSLSTICIHFDLGLPLFLLPVIPLIKPCFVGMSWFNLATWPNHFILCTHATLLIDSSPYISNISLFVLLSHIWPIFSLRIFSFRIFLVLVFPSSWVSTLHRHK